MVWVEDFVAVHHRNEVFSVREIDDVMGVAGEHYHALNLVSADLIFKYLRIAIFVQLVRSWILGPHLDESVTFYHYELLPFGVVPVLALGDARFADVDADLTAVQGVNQFGEGASVVHVHLQVEDCAFLWKIAEIGAVESLGKAVSWNLRNHQGLWHFLELMEQINDFSESCLMGDWAVAVLALRVWKYLQALKFAVMLLALECADHLLHEVVDVKNLQFNTWVIDSDWKVIGDIVAEGGDCTVVVRAAPFAVEIWETVNQNLYPILLSILQEKVLPCFLASAVLTVAETACERGLSAAGEHHRGLVAVLFEGVKKGTGKSEVAFHKLLRIFRTVDSRKIEHEIALGTPLLELLRGAVKVIFEDLIYCEISVALGLACPDIIELGAKVLSYETLGSGYKYLHYYSLL